jgi:hypothetical protein
MVLVVPKEDNQTVWQAFGLVFPRGVLIRGHNFSPNGLHFADRKPSGFDSARVF